MERRPATLREPATQQVADGEDHRERDDDQLHRPRIGALGTEADRLKPPAANAGPSPHRCAGDPGDRCVPLNPVSLTPGFHRRRPPWPAPRGAVSSVHDPVEPSLASSLFLVPTPGFQRAPAASSSVAMVAVVYSRCFQLIGRCISRPTSFVPCSATSAVGVGRASAGSAVLTSPADGPLAAGVGRSVDTKPAGPRGRGAPSAAIQAVQLLGFQPARPPWRTPPGWPARRSTLRSMVWLLPRASVRRRRRRHHRTASNGRRRRAAAWRASRRCTRMCRQFTPHHLLSHPITSFVPVPEASGGRPPSGEGRDDPPTRGRTDVAEACGTTRVHGVR